MAEEQNDSMAPENMLPEGAANAGQTVEHAAPETPQQSVDLPSKNPETPTAEPVAEMEYFQCHKVVKAAKIYGINTDYANENRLDLDSAVKFVIVDDAWMVRHNPQIGGYFVEYEDGYTSFSPAEAFEKGYTPMRNVRLETPFSIIPLAPVYPSNEPSVFVLVDDGDHYGGAHKYQCVPSLGFEDGKAVYDHGHIPMVIEFVHKPLDGGPTKAGLQSEQLLIILRDRHEKLNAAFPSKHHRQFIEGIDLALDALKRRVNDRMARGVMGQLAK